MDNEIFVYNDNKDRVEMSKQSDIIEENQMAKVIVDHWFYILVHYLSYLQSATLRRKKSSNALTAASAGPRRRQRRLTKSKSLSSESDAGCFSSSQSSVVKNGDTRGTVEDLNQV